MKASELTDRTRLFSVQVIKLVDKAPKTPAGLAVTEALVKCGLSVGAKYRSMCRAHNPYDFTSRISDCEEAADECVYWLDVMLGSELLPSAEINPVIDEARKLQRILSKSLKAANKRQSDQSHRGGGAGGGSESGEEDIPF